LVQSDGGDVLDQERPIAVPISVCGARWLRPGNPTG
jgi:hypothetical protein